MLGGDPAAEEHHHILSLLSGHGGGRCGTSARLPGGCRGRSGGRRRWGRRLLRKCRRSEKTQRYSEFSENADTSVHRAIPTDGLALGNFSVRYSSSQGFRNGNRWGQPGKKPLADSQRRKTLKQVREEPDQASTRKTLKIKNEVPCPAELQGMTRRDEPIDKRVGFAGRGEYRGFAADG